MQTIDTTAAELLGKLNDRYVGRFSIDYNTYSWHVYDFETKKASIYNLDGTLHQGEIDFLAEVRS